MSNKNSLYILVSNGPDNNWIRKDAGPIARWWNSPSRVGRTKRWLSENVAPGRWIGEQVSSEYSEQMNILKNIHDQVESWTKDLSNALDRAQDARKLGKPLDAIFWLGQINNRLKLVTNEKDKLQNLQDKYLEKYFEEHEQDIPDDYFETGANKIVEAGVFNDLGRKVTNWKFQRAHKLRLKEQDMALKNLLSKAEQAVNHTYSLLHKMSSALGSGDISGYLEVLEKIGAYQADFEQKFRSVYDEHFAAMVTRIKAKKQQEAERAAKITEEANQREAERLKNMLPGKEKALPEDLATQLKQRVEQNKAWMLQSKNDPSQLDTQIDVKKQWPESGSTTQPEPAIELDDTALPTATPDTPPDTAPSTEQVLKEQTPEGREEEWQRRMRRNNPPPTSRSQADIEMEDMIVKMNHVKFHEELKKASAKNDPYLLAAMMLKYSEMIDDVDPQKSLELLSIAEGILNA